MKIGKHSTFRKSERFASKHQLEIQEDKQAGSCLTTTVNLTGDLVVKSKAT
jgi:hypothetical protein